MILIGDVGGSTTEWRVIENGAVKQFKSVGINIIHDTPVNFLKLVDDSISPYKVADKVYLYFAGLMEARSKRRGVIKDIRKVFTKSEVYVENDLLAAARGLCQRNEGWIGILGTGSNFAFYNGENITERIPTLGYILGDEGSGSYFGKKLLSDFARNRLPKDLDEIFRKRYKLDESLIIEKVYNPVGSKVFLGAFSKFLLQNINHPYCYELVYQSFIDHFQAMTSNYDLSAQVHYTGSVAYFFNNILRKAAGDVGITIGNITESPIAGLALFHNDQE